MFWSKRATIVLEDSILTLKQSHQMSPCFWLCALPTDSSVTSETKLQIFTLWDPQAFQKKYSQINFPLLQGAEVTRLVAVGCDIQTNPTALLQESGLSTLLVFASFTRPHIFAEGSSGFLGGSWNAWKIQQS